MYILKQPSMSDWRLRPYRLHHLHEWWSHLANSEAPPWLVLGDWVISVHYEVLRFAVFLNEKFDFWLRFACWPFSTTLSEVFWQECLTEMPGSPEPFPLLVCLRSVSWHTYSIESSAWPIQDLPRPSLHPFVSFTAFWSGLLGFSTALKYALTCSIFCLVCIGGRSCHLMFQVFTVNGRIILFQVSKLAE